MTKTITSTEALVRLRALCSKSEKCPKDVIDKLKQWKYYDDPQPIIDELEQDNYINESRFAGSFVNDKIKFSKWGKIKVFHQLKLKGISEEISMNCLNDFPKEEYLHIIVLEIKKKNKALKEEDIFKRKNKLQSFGYQRGFEHEILIDVIERVISRV